MEKSTFFLRSGAVIALGFLAVLGATHWSDTHTGAHPETAAVTSAAIQRGAYLARVGDCAACHSVAGKAPFSGGLQMMTPIGAIYTSNITPDRQHGIGNYTLADFDRALRYGVADGHTLYPAMPYSAFSRTAPEDVAALYAFFMHGVQPDQTPNRANDIPFPLSMRFPLTIWRWAFAPEPKPFKLQSDDAVLRRGAYLVEGLGHCGDCHTPRSAALQVKALTAADGPDYLSGAHIDNWLAPSLRNGGRSTLGAWSEADIAQFLRTGNNRHGIVFASMNDVVSNSTKYFSDGDAAAVAHFLKSLKDDTPDPTPKPHRASSTIGIAELRGAKLYADNCAACHQADGKGIPGQFPPLAGNPVAAAASANDVIRIVLEGSPAGVRFVMPAFAHRLDDQQIANIATYVRASWNNQAPPVEASAVRKLRH